MGFLFSRPVKPTPPRRHPSIVHLQDYVGLPLPTVMATLRKRDILTATVAIKPNEPFDPKSVQAPTGALLVVYNCENDYVERLVYHTG